MKWLFILLFAFWASYSNAQTLTEVPGDFKNKLYQVFFPIPSNDGNWTAFKKAYQTNSDTLVVVDTRFANKVVLEEGNVQSFSFTHKNKLFYKKGQDLVLFDPKTKAKTKWAGVSKNQYLEDDEIMIIFQQNDQNTRLLILDEQGQEIEKIDHASSYKVIDGDVYAVTQKGGNYQVWSYSKKCKHLLFENPQKITFILESSAGLLFTEAGRKAGYSKLAYFSYQDQRVIRLSDRADIEFKTITTKFIGDSRKVFVQGATDKVDAGKKIVDIWYGGAKDLKAKFYDQNFQLTNFIWDVADNSLERLADKRVTNYFYTGSRQYVYALNAFENEDYVSHKTYPLYKYDISQKKYDFLGELGQNTLADISGDYLLSGVPGQWKLFDMRNNTVTQLPKSLGRSFRGFFSKKSDAIVFEELDGLVVYDIKTGQTEQIAIARGSITELMNFKTFFIDGEFRLTSLIVDLDKPLIVRSVSPVDYTYSLSVVAHKKVKLIADAIPHRINNIRWNESFSHLVYATEGLNFPPRLNIYGRSNREIYSSNLQDSIARKIKYELHTYTNSKGKALNGVLIYPLSYQKSKKYPMIVNIYENQSKLRNQFLLDGFAGSTDAFNIRYYLKRGYMVFLPDIVYDDRGTGFSALDCVESGMLALKENQFIDFSRVGLIGFSHGGYETNFIATQSNLFRTYLGGAGNSDLVRSYFSFNYNFLKPFYFQFENGQYRMPKPFSQDKELYIKNSPVYFAEKVNAPILLWAGMKDQNIYWEQTMEFYLGLQRNKKNVVALFYPDQAHGFQALGAKIDIYTKVSDWFEHYLKDETPADWIAKGRN